MKTNNLFFISKCELQAALKTFTWSAIELRAALTAINPFAAVSAAIRRIAISSATAAMMLLVLGGGILLTSCYKSDIDDLKKEQQDLESRVKALEEWQKSVNTDISGLQTIVNALQGKDYVTGVTALSDGSGYTITFSNSGEITIKNGKDGEAGKEGEKGITPIIGVKQYTEEEGGDGNYYWTIDLLDGKGVQWMKDSAGNMIRTTGDKGETGEQGTAGTTPKVRINAQSGEWEIAADGVNYVTTGIKAQGERGDAIFAENGVDLSNEGEVKFTLADGTVFTVPRAMEIKITLNGNEDIETLYGENVIPFNIDGLTKDNYRGIVAEIKSKGGAGTAVRTKAEEGSPWIVEITEPEFDEDGKYIQNNDTITIKVAEGDYNKEELCPAEIRLTVIDTKGREITGTIMSKAILYYPGTTERPVKIGNTIWAPVNCGYDENHKYGLLYQWGRKDGQGYVAGDTSPFKEHANDPEQKIETTTATSGNHLTNPDANTFYTNESSPYDWYAIAEVDQNNNLWNTGDESNPVKTATDPCPEGWRVPTKTELESLKGASDLINNSTWKEASIETPNEHSGRWFGENHATATVTNPQECIFLPAAGIRYFSIGFAYNRGDYGDYWSSTPYDIYAYNLGFNFGLAFMNSVSRASGFSVRCVKE